MEQIAAPRVNLSPSKGGSTMSNMPPAGSVTKRLGNELMGLMMSAPPGISAFPSSDENIFEWVGRIEGSPGTVYEGLAFKISISFPANYPYTAPTIKFTTPCFHPNVSNNGDICLDILKEKWSAVYSVQTVLVSLQSLLGEPNNDSPLCVEAAELWDDQKAFKSRLMQLYRPIP
ncbi:Ubiquitin-conjugating enzyme E2 11 [Tulasnella sp. JGI-2019a]|nr:Ubiquitin-conjugating enzyme E2 11 [Tulasnella sp. JGI-2019a]KAG9016207.1 Ubiquitin-conjugating enzyme E2 11 [Tulasnella sp. JGI-2019a]KAG9036482.1 Ubiquitin-conjugating enzyme E2 11 [Tulasnella sp. JGI-2019a]